jgi:voltage-gated potassium channel
MVWCLVPLGCEAASDVSAPRTALGRALAVVLAVLVGALFIGPVWIVATEARRVAHAAKPGLSCSACGVTEHRSDASYCRRCGAQLVDRNDVKRRTSRGSDLLGE